MNRRRDGLLPGMEARQWKCGTRTAYRYHPPGGKPIALGYDLSEAIRQVLNLTGQAPHHGSLTWLWEQFQTSKRWKRLAEGTQADYRTAWAAIDKHLGGQLPAASITSNRIARYVHIDRADAPRRADIEKALLSGMFKHGILLEVCTTNPTIGVEPHGSAPSKVKPTDRALQAFSTWLAAEGGQRLVLSRMVRFAALAGSRRCEFLAATWAQVDRAAGTIELPRAKQRGRVVLDAIKLSPALLALLDELPTEGPYLFTTRGGNPYTDRGFKSLWQRAVADAIEAGVLTKAERFNFHALRRYYTTKHDEQFNDLPNLHADRRVTERVYNAKQTKERKAL